MNPFEMVVAIVAIGAVASVLRAKYGVVRRWKGEEMVARPGPDPEAQALREEIRQLKARVATLERIATDSSSSLDREIESLRDRP
ncbi:MAG: hypothetical protein ACTHOJ_07975 [Sphingomonas oligoaromativorans]|jgi:hypothetical protein|uniref:hypothetical protein n=1 Tax=Sphingomonas oligoaromativorans TaxID=575322 RepID=UPI00141EE720|nr:hypothetical protein [Sphingomonas oligoaromativorans]NIJ33497.1 hypothetical protein [Sphingomonas oligoaromativorans]